jgi:hypothetical protein
MFRVTRSGEFLPFWRLLIWDSGLKITEVAQFFGLRLCTYVLIVTKKVGLHYGRLVLKTHLVALVMLVHAPFHPKFCARLPDAIFSNQKSQFGYILERSAMKDVDKFYRHMVNFTAISYNLWQNIFLVILVHFFQF